MQAHNAAFLEGKGMKKQVNFRFNEEQLAALEQLQADLKAESQAETLRRSLNLVGALLESVKDGYEIILRKNDEEKHLHLVT